MTKIDPVKLTCDLIRRPSITPDDEGAQDILEEALTSIGFSCRRMIFAEDGAAPVSNLYARWGTKAPVFAYAGHTDVVPPGDESDWTHSPFDAAISDGFVWGRGAADMKGAIAAFAAAAERAVNKGVAGSIVLIITGDEEGPAINGTRRVLGWMASAGEKIDHCLVGEPSSSAALGDMIKVGRRGSMNCRLKVRGAQGHVAYPDRAQNPIPGLLKKLLTLSETPLDDGYDHFQPSSLQVTDIHVGNPAPNVIPARAEARFNIRFNPNWTGATLEALLRGKLDEAARASGLAYELEAICSGEAFLTTDEEFISLVVKTITEETGVTPDQSTTGGTSDARFIRFHAPVIEFGLVGASIHKVDEHAATADIEKLAGVYERILARYFETFSARQ